MSQQINVFLYFEQCTLVNKRRVLLSDVASIYASDPVMKQKIGAIELHVFPEKKKEKLTFCVMKVIELIGTAYPEVSVTPLGEPDFIVEYKAAEKKKYEKILEWGKALFVCLTVFFGAAFTIMTFNKDASVEEIFALIYKLTEGAERSAPGELEIAYSIGLPIGIILFFNHFLRKKIDSDPTPLQVQMRQYEKDVNTTIIENASREGNEKNV
ncbi:MAG: stage V sporulation protein AA [Lachnospiraceae bacterium]|nr:stage V sporulation protein AA [Lachnospiraceae bacterium]